MFELEGTIASTETNDRLAENPKLYIPSTPNNSNETHTLMCLGRTGRFWQH